LGVDLGTCCTKVVIGDPGWKDCSFAVPLTTSRNGISTWLHPTRLGAETNLKMRLMDKPLDDDIQDIVACYLAEVMNLSCSWFAANCPTDYRRRENRWKLNLGFPGKKVDSGSLAAAYHEVAGTAVALSSQPEPPSPQLAASIRRKTTTFAPFIAPSHVQLYPEIAAQLAGYVNSPYRHRGNLVLIDVGAGTLDTSTIILHGDQEYDIVSFHVCEVAPLGALRLYQERSSALKRIQADCIQHELECYQGGDKPIPELFQDIVHPQYRNSPELKETFQAVSKEFEHNVIDSPWSCLARFRTIQRNAHDNPAYDPWGDELLCFITGGGSRSRFYRRLLADGPLEEKLIPFSRWHPEPWQRHSWKQGLRLEKMPMPDPEKLREFPTSLSKDFDRLSVAYGLAFGGENLMKVTAATHQ